VTRPVPPGRWLKASAERWEAWAGSNAAALWEPNEWATAERLLQLTDDYGRAKDPAERRRMAPQLRTLERDLALLAKKPKPATDGDVRKRERKRFREWSALHFGPTPEAWDRASGNARRACDLWQEMLLAAPTISAAAGVSRRDEAMIDHCVEVHGYLREDFTLDTRDPRLALHEA
jgi:hypothetical protein